MRAGRVVRAVAAEARDDRLLGLAGETAFFGVLGIFPGLLLGTGLLGVLDLLVGADLAAAAQQKVVDALDAVFTDQAAGVVASVRDLFDRGGGGLLTVAALGALVTLSGAFAVVIEALNLAYGVHETRSWVRRRLLGLGLGLATVLAIVLAVSVVVVGPFLGTGRQIADFVGLGDVFATAWGALRIPLLVIGLALWATALFHLAPHRRARWRESVPGALLTTALWIAATAGLHLYLALAAGVNPVLGAFGGGAIVMTWAYLLSVALLLGGELNAVLCRGGRRRPATDDQLTTS
ncbi:YihY/virulence factor BrkB family protein [Pseudonocardia saturnea]